MAELDTLRRHAEALFGPDEQVVGAFVGSMPVRGYPGWLAGCLPAAAWNIVADVLMSPFRRRRQRAVVVTTTGIALLGAFDPRGLPTEVLERLPGDAHLSAPDWSAGDVAVTVGTTVLWVQGASIDEARRLARSVST